MQKSSVNIKIAFLVGVILITCLSIVCGFSIGKNGISDAFSVILLLIVLLLVAFVPILIKIVLNKVMGFVIEDLKHSSNDIAVISSELTVNGKTLTEGTSTQASSIKQTVSTLDEFSSTIHQTAENAKEADNLANRAKSAADKGADEIKKMLDVISELKKSSTEVSKIIKVIDDIAFQTNLLSLNAAVEAARAGEAGKGFAVVAEEVRTLAQRSAQAAKDTEEIIASNIILSDDTLAISEEVNETLAQIQQESYKVTKLINEIAVASNEQDTGILQINNALNQVEAIIKSTTVTAQGTVSAAARLEAFLSNVDDIVSALMQAVEYTEEASSRFKKQLENRISKQEKDVVKKDSMKLFGATKSKNKANDTKKKIEKVSSKEKSKNKNAKKSKEPFVVKSETGATPRLAPVKTQTAEEKVKEIQSTKIDNKEETFVAPAPKVVASDVNKINPEDIIPLDDF